MAARTAMLALLAAATLAGAQPKDVPPAPGASAPGALAGLGWLVDLAGSCWKGDWPDGKTSDTQCYLVQYERLLRGSIKLYRASGEPPSFEGDAVFSPDPAGGKRIVYTQWGTGGVYATGEITFEGETLIFRNRQPDSGAPAPVRSVWRRTGADSFRVTRERSDDSGWKEFLVVDYRRLR